MIIAVLLKVDNGGTATVLCTEVLGDPIFPDKVVLKGVVGLSWPVAGKYMKVEQWSVLKETVLNWMVGPLRDTFDLDMGMLSGDEKELPLPPGFNPHQDLVNHPSEVAGLVVDVPDTLPEMPAEPAAPAVAATPSRNRRKK